ncbi:phosphopantetheine-binding protein [Actinophytocola sp.]|uniref:phosphopantetheine-binding protein n=1 Tax=Actinophytocola sp. TaxID=1872138 RepID=UPI003899FC27
MSTRSTNTGDSRLLDQLVALWRETLADPEIGPDDNFFTVGGHSLLALRLLGRLHELTGVELTLVDLLEAPTPAELLVAHGTALSASAETEN